MLDIYFIDSFDTYFIYRIGSCYVLFHHGYFVGSYSSLFDARLALNDYAYDDFLFEAACCFD